MTNLELQRLLDNPERVRRLYEDYRIFRKQYADLYDAVIDLLETVPLDKQIAACKNLYDLIGE